MTTALRVLGLNRDRWILVGPSSFWPSAALAVGASVLLALTRFGGLIFDAPRAFLRMTLVGIYGWLGLSLGIWLIAAGLRAKTVPGTKLKAVLAATFAHTVVAVGLAHLPLLVFGLVIFIAADLLQIFGPGLVVAWFAFGFWFPARLAVATRHTHRLDLGPAVAAVAVPYLVWLLTVGRHLLGQVEHLL